MPYKSRYRKYYKSAGGQRRLARRKFLADMRDDARSRAQARYRRHNGLTRVPSNLPRPPRWSPSATAVRTKMRYHETYDVGNGANYNFLNRYRMGSVYDPSMAATSSTGTTSTGDHQPEGFNALAALYRRYRVHSCYYTVKIITKSHNDFIRWMTFITPHSVTINAGDDMDPLIEGCGTDNKLRYGVMMSRDSPSGIEIGRGLCDIARVEGDFVGRAEASGYTGTDTASPSFSPKLNIMIETVEQNIPAAGDIYYDVTLVYDVEWYDRKFDAVVD